MIADLKLVVVAQEFPYPPSHGGRADVWRRLRAMKALGAKLALVCWFDDADGKRPSPAEQRAVEAVVEILEATPKQRGIKHDLLRLARIAAGVPSHAAARVMAKESLTRIIERLAAFAPDALLLESPYGGVFALSACQELNVPMFYRSHNIEHKYFQGQAAAAVSLRDRLAWRVACFHLAAFEQRMMDAAEISFDISADDSAFWTARGVRNSVWLPPLPEATSYAGIVAKSIVQQDRELAFLGNLNAPNNVRGVRWLIEEVMPIVRQRRPQTVLTIAGSRPSIEIRTLVDEHSYVQLMEDIPDAPQFLAASRVLVNPVLTGSGVNVKTLDMLMTDRPIISTPQGVAGLVPEIKALCIVADSPGEFSDAVLMALAAPAVDYQAREAGRALFSIDAVATALDAICGVAQKPDSSRYGTRLFEAAR